MIDYGEELIKSLRSDTADVLVLAGDILSFKRGIEPLIWAGEKFKDVVYVPGNHEYWEWDATDGPRQIGLPDNVHLLDNSAVTIQGQRFLGGTMWFPKTPDTLLLKSTWIDFKKIQKFNPWVWEQNEAALEFFKNNIKNDDIVITHHAPSRKSIADRWLGDPYNCYYVCDKAEYIMLQKEPMYWFHGHMHSNFDYNYFNTRVICNPRGNRRVGHIENPHFDEFLVIDV